MASATCVNGFTVSIHPGGVISAQEAEPLSPHDLILRPILQFAELAVVLDAPSDSRAVQEAAAILSPEPRRWRIMLDREVFRGYERLWNTGSCERGTIAIKSRITNDCLESLFSLCGAAWQFAERDEHKVFGKEGLSFAAAESSHGCRVFMLSRSNGIEWLGVYGLSDEIAMLYANATSCCKPFKRWFEVPDPDRYNIIGQYDSMWLAKSGDSSNIGSATPEENRDSLVGPPPAT